MIREKRTDAKGKTYTVLIPENEADLAELRRLEKAGQVDARESFGDDPAVWGFAPEDTDAL